MKKICFWIIALSLPCVAFGEPVNLVQVFQQALTNDPTYLQAISQRLSTREGVPISLAALLPNVSLTANGPQLSRELNSGAAITVRSGTSKGYAIALNLTQTIFDFAQFSTLASQHALAKGADATLNAATQDLIVRVAKAYFQVLQDEDNLLYLKATRTAYQRQLDQVTEQYNVGLKTITDVYTAKASYQTSVAGYIGAESTLANDRENLRAITNQYYPDLAKLNENFPLVSPKPSNINDWVTTAGQQNWAVRSAQYSAESSRQIIKQQFAGHLPTVQAQAGWENQYSYTSSSSVYNNGGSLRTETTSGTIAITIPLFAGGGVIAATRQAQYNYQVALQQLEYQLRSTLAQTRQSYLNIVSGISKIRADRQSIQSAISSLEGMRAAYQVGTETLVDVLNQQQNVFQVQQQYAADRYSYVNNYFALKQAAGTLSFNDIEAVNVWLGSEKKQYTPPHLGPEKTQHTSHLKSEKKQHLPHHSHPTKTISQVPKPFATF
ncbi:MAG: TolC family outer membrane protein [Gammaproteobacteria bacterium]|nr:TolC family outer membrane protein [Gammaproteobacteria bacterium]